MEQCKSGNFRTDEAVTRNDPVELALDRPREFSLPLRRAPDDEFSMADGRIIHKRATFPFG